MRVAIVLGTRPEVMKNWSIVEALRQSGVSFLVLHTGQQSRSDMSEDVFAMLGYEPDLMLPGDYSVGRAVDWTMDMISEHRVNLVVVNGDTAAALVGSVAAVYSDVSLAHVEAGLRSGDKEMREERNRIMVDAAAHHLFAYTKERARALEEWSDRRGTVHLVGNTTVDLVEAVLHRLTRPSPETYLYVTLHRKELTDRVDRLVRVLFKIATLRDCVDRIVLPMHPRTRDVLVRNGVDPGAIPGVEVVPPLNPIESLAYIRHAEVVLTDSGCIQEEAYLLRTPCVTVRANTERPETQVGGANLLSGFGPGSVRAAALVQLYGGCNWDSTVYGAPGVGQRIVDVMIDSRAGSYWRPPASLAHRPAG